MKVHWSHTPPGTIFSLIKKYLFSKVGFQSWVCHDSRQEQKKAVSNLININKYQYHLSGIKDVKYVN